MGMLNPGSAYSWQTCGKDSSPDISQSWRCAASARHQTNPWMCTSHDLLDRVVCLTDIEHPAAYDPSTRGSRDEK
jgi:hypothetical protein